MVQRGFPRVQSLTCTANGIYLWYLGQLNLLQNWVSKFCRETCWREQAFLFCMVNHIFRAYMALSRLWGRLVGCVQGREVGACAHLAFRGLSCCEASVTLSLWLRLQAQSAIAICSHFCRPEGINKAKHLHLLTALRFILI